VWSVQLWLAWLGSVARGERERKEVRNSGIEAVYNSFATKYNEMTARCCARGGLFSGMGTGKSRILGDSN